MGLCGQNGLDARGNRFAGQTEESALLVLRVVLHEHVGNADALDAPAQPAIGDELDDRRAEAAGERVLFEGDERGVWSRASSISSASSSGLAKRALTTVGSSPTSSSLALRMP